jgi:MraZ protein
MSFSSGRSFEATVDPKGRLRLPSKLVEQLGEELGTELKVNIGMDGSVDLYTLSNWSVLAAAAAKQNLFDPKIRNFQRMFFGMSSELEIDDQKRVLLPRRFLEKAGIDKDVTIITYSDKIEIWPTERLENMDSQNEMTYSDLGAYAMGGAFFGTSPDQQ